MKKEDKLKPVKLSKSYTKTEENAKKLEKYLKKKQTSGN